MSNSTSYEGLAYVYDRLMADAPYEKWLAFAEKCWKDISQNPESVIDLACGTGTFTILLAERGYHVTGIDLSQDMLAVTDRKAREKQLHVPLFHQDMCDFSVLSPADAVVCFCDSLSYLTEEANIMNAFRAVYKSLKHGGSFLFDVHSPHKINHVYADNIFTLIEEEIAYIWECGICGPNVVEHMLTIFLKEGALYRKCEETHFQRGYSAEEINALLRMAGFTDIRTSAEFGEGPVSSTSERLFFSAVKK